ncbi:MAG: hypothetical protein GX341_05845 [Firmicutes bacterium]|jgi:lipopolysaccharide assembly outer membrane protein LptD (OstA)|nr:hypothetical protein [Bacillota bacterium]
MEEMALSRKLGRLLAGMILAGILVLGVSGQNLGWAAEQAGGKKDNDVVRIIIHTELPDAEVGVFQLDKKTAVIEPAQGHVEVLTGDTRMTAAKLIYNQSEDTAQLSGDVTIAREDLDAQADNMLADLAQETYILDGSVYLKQWEKEDEAERAVKLEVWSSWLQIHEEGKKLLARGDVQVIETDRKAWADELEYDDGEELAILMGSVRLETADGNILTGSKVVINLSTDEATVYGPTYAEFILGEDE